MPSPATLPPPAPPQPGTSAAGLYILAIGQTICWSGLYYSFAALLFSWEQQLGWAKTDLTLGLAASILIAAVLAPVAGRIIDADGGRWLLTGGAFAGAASLCGLAATETQTGFLLAWCAIGVTQAMCLYEPCFAFMTRALEAGAPAAILRLTLVAGFASPISFTLGAFFATHYGWQTAVYVYAALIVVLGAPLHFIGARLLELRSGNGDTNLAARRHAAERGRVGLQRALRKPSFWLMALAFPLIGLNHGLLLNHLIPLLVERGVAQATAVTAASLIGPMQIVGRLMVFRFENRATMLALTFISIGGLVVAGTLLLLAGASTMLVVAFAMTQGAAYGLVSVLRPAVIAETLGRDGFGSIAGWLAVPYLAAFAVAPYVGALLWERGGYDLAVAFALGCAVVGFAAVRPLKAMRAREAAAGRSRD